MVAYRPKRICAGQESEEEGGGRWCPDREQGDAAGPLSGPRRQRPECPSFLGVGCCASRRLRTTTTTVGPALRLLAQRECRDLCVKPDSTAAVAVARRNRNRRRGRGRRRKARGAESRQPGRMELRPGCKSPDRLGLGVRCEVQCDVREVVEAMMMNESTGVLAAEEDRDRWSGKPSPAGAEGARGKQLSPCQSARGTGPCLDLAALPTQHSSTAHSCAANFRFGCPAPPLIMEWRGFRSSSCFVTLSAPWVLCNPYGAPLQAQVKDCHVEALFGT